MTGTVPFTLSDDAVSSAPALKAMGVVARAKDKGLAREQHYKSFNKRVEQPEQPEREKTPWGSM